MPRARKFAEEDLTYSTFFGPPGRVDVAPTVDSSISRSLAAGLCIFEDCAMVYTMTYDDVLYILEGELVFRTDDYEVRCGPGDTMWVPDTIFGTFEAHGRCKVFYAVHPVDWDEKAGFKPA